MGTKITPKHKKIMDKLNVPIVVVAQYMDNYPCVYHDDFNAAKYMTEYLIGKGHKNIGFIGVYEEDRSVGLERENGYIAAYCQSMSNLTIAPNEYIDVYINFRLIF